MQASDYSDFAIASAVDGLKDFVNRTVAISEFAYEGASIRATGQGLRANGQGPR